MRWLLLSIQLCFLHWTSGSVHRRVRRQDFNTVLALAACQEEPESELCLQAKEQGLYQTTTERTAVADEEDWLLRACRRQQLEYCPDQISCEWGEWSAWTACSQQCGGGERDRTRTLPEECDVAEGQQTATQTCNSQACPTTTTTSTTTRTTTTTRAATTTTTTVGSTQPPPATTTATMPADDADTNDFLIYADLCNRYQDAYNSDCYEITKAPVEIEPYLYQPCKLYAELCPSVPLEGPHAFSGRILDLLGDCDKFKLAFESQCFSITEQPVEFQIPLLRACPNYFRVCPEQASGTKQAAGGQGGDFELPSRDARLEDEFLLPSKQSAWPDKTLPKVPKSVRVSEPDAARLLPPTAGEPLGDPRLPAFDYDGVNIDPALPDNLRDEFLLPNRPRVRRPFGPVGLDPSYPTFTDIRRRRT